MRRLGVALFLFLAGCGSLSGSAAGTCRVRYGTRGGAPAIAGGERTDRVTVAITEDGDVLTMRMEGCTLKMHRTPPAPHTNPHYLVDEGSQCAWDVPGLGQRTFRVANRPHDPRITDGISYEGYANFAQQEIFVVFEAAVEAGDARFDCDLTRTD